MTRPARILLVLCFFLSVRGAGGGKDTIASFFPSVMGSWTASDSLRLFSGKKLYDLIDGGADVFLEYGFVRAGSRHYGSPGGGEISVEVHEMRDTLAGWGMFSFLAAGTGTPSGFGQEGVEGEDFVIFRQNRFVVLVTALNENGRAGIGAMAAVVSRRIRPGGRMPRLAEVLLRPEFRNSDVLLLKGPLAFDRRAEIGLGSVFPFRVGVSGIFAGCKTFVLEYRGVHECQMAVQRGIRLLETRAGYTEHSRDGGAQLLSDSKGKVLHLARDRRYLLLTTGESEEIVRSTAGALWKAASIHLEP